jgi:hypothetical protein
MIFFGGDDVESTEERKRAITCSRREKTIMRRRKPRFPGDSSNALLKVI